MTTCINCKFWVKHTFTPTQISRGYCHRYPPISTSGPIASWPMSYESDWCGEFVESSAGPLVTSHVEGIGEVIMGFDPAAPEPASIIRMDHQQFETRVKKSVKSSLNAASKVKSKKVKHVTNKDAPIV